MYELESICTWENAIIDFIFQEMKDQMASPAAMSLSDKKNRQVCTLSQVSNSGDYGKHNMFISRFCKAMAVCVKSNERDVCLFVRL